MTCPEFVILKTLHTFMNGVLSDKNQIAVPSQSWL